MFYAYVVKSLNHDYYYKGHCQNITVRLQQHNSGMTKSLKPYLPVQLVYFETFQTAAEAVQREKYFKTAAGRKYLEKQMVP